MGTRTNINKSNGNGTNLATTKSQNQQNNGLSEQMGPRNQNYNTTLHLDKARPSVPCPSTTLVLSNKGSNNNQTTSVNQSSTQKQRKSNQSNFSRGQQHQQEQTNGQFNTIGGRHEASNKLRQNFSKVYKKSLNTLEVWQVDRHHASLTQPCAPPELQQQAKATKRPKYINLQKKAMRESVQKNGSHDGQVVKQQQHAQRQVYQRATTNFHLKKPQNILNNHSNNALLNLNIRADNEDGQSGANLGGHPSTSRSRQVLPPPPSAKAQQAPPCLQQEYDEQKAPNQPAFYNRRSEQEEGGEMEQPPQHPVQAQDATWVANPMKEEPRVREVSQASLDEDTIVKRDRFNTSQFERNESSCQEAGDPMSSRELGDQRRKLVDFVMMNNMLTENKNLGTKQSLNSNNMNCKNSSISQISQNIYEKSEWDKNHKSLGRFSEKPSQGAQDVRFDRRSYQDNPKLTNTVESMVMNATAGPAQGDNQISETSPCDNSQKKHQQKIVVNDKSVSQKDRNRRRVDGAGGAKDLKLLEGKKLQMALTEISNCESLDASHKNLKKENWQIIQTQQCPDGHQVRRQQCQPLMFNVPSQTDLTPSQNDQTQKESEVNLLQMRSSEVLARQNAFQKKFSEFVVSHLGGADIVTSFNNSENIQNTQKGQMFDFLKNKMNQKLKSIATESHGNQPNNKSQSLASHSQCKDGSWKSRTWLSSSIPSQRLPQGNAQMAELLNIQQQINKGQNDELWNYIFDFEKRVERNISEINQKQDQILQILLNQRSKSFFSNTAPDSNHLQQPEVKINSYNSPVLSASQTHQAVIVDSNTYSNVLSPNAQLSPSHLGMNSQIVQHNNYSHLQNSNNLVDPSQNYSSQIVQGQNAAGFASQRNQMNLAEQEQQEDVQEKIGSVGGRGGKVVVEFEDDEDDDQLDAVKLQKQRSEIKMLSKSVHQQCYEPRIHFQGNSLKHIPQAASQKSIQNSQSEKNAIKTRGSQDIPKPPTATFRYTPGQSGTEGSKECLNDEAHFPNPNEQCQRQNYLNTQNNESRFKTIENQISQAKQQLANRLSTLRTQSMCQESIDNEQPKDQRYTRLSPEFVQEIENLNLDQNLDLSFFKDNGRNIILAQSSSKRQQPPPMANQMQHKSPSKSPLPITLSPDDQSLQFSNDVNTMMKNMPPNLQQPITSNQELLHKNMEPLKQPVHQYPLTEFSELRNHTDSLVAPLFCSNAQNAGAHGAGHGQHTQAHQQHGHSTHFQEPPPQHHGQYNSMPSTLYAGALNQSGGGGGHRHHGQKPQRQLFIIVDPSTGEEASAYLDRDQVRKMMVGCCGDTAADRRPAVDAAEDYQAEPVESAMSKGVDMSSCQQQWMPQEQQSIQQQLDDLYSQKEQILDQYQQIKNRTMQLEHELSKGEQMWPDQQATLENEQQLCKLPSQGQSISLLVDQNAQQSILSTESVNPMINMKEKILKNTAKRQTSKSQHGNALPYPLSSPHKKLMSDMTNIFGHSFVTSHDQLQLQENAGEASMIRAAVTHGPPSREASIVNPAHGRHSSDLYFKGHKIVEEEDNSRNVVQQQQFSPEILSSFLTILNSYNMECHHQQRQQIKQQQLSQQKTVQSAQPAVRDDFEQIIDVGQAIKNLESQVKTEPLSGSLLHTPVAASALHLDPLTLQHATALLKSTLKNSGQQASRSGGHVVPTPTQAPFSHLPVTTPPLPDDHDSTSRQDFDNLKELGWSTSSQKQRVLNIQQKVSSIDQTIT